MRKFFVDGCAIKNPGGPIGWAAVDEQGEFLGGGGAAESQWGVGTNNIAELLGVREALVYASDGKPTAIYSDSEYAINQLTAWEHLWRRRASRGKFPPNYALLCHVKELLAAAANVELRWIKGHSGVVGNEAADFHARRLADEARSSRRKA